MMKKIFLIIITTFLFANENQQVLRIVASSKILNIDVLSKFAIDNNIKIEYIIKKPRDIYQDIIKGNSNNYDILLITSNYIHKMIENNFLNVINKNKIPNIKYLFRDKLYKGYDKKNSFSIPFRWSTSIIVYNANIIKINSWDDLWRKRLKNKIYIRDDLRDIFAISLKSLLLSANSKSQIDIKKAYYKLTHLVENIAMIDNYDNLLDEFLNKNIYCAVLSTDEAYNLIEKAKKSNLKLNYIYPKEGVMYYIDAFTIPIGSKNINLAHKFLNYISSVDITRKLIKKYPYATCNLEAKRYFSYQINKSPILYQNRVFLEISEFKKDLGSKYVLYLKYWRDFLKKVNDQ